MSEESSPTVLVIDNSVALKWYLPEQFSDHALRAFYAGRDGYALLLAPTLIHAEFGNILWRHYEDSKLSLEEIRYYWTDFRITPLRFVESEMLVSAALDIAADTHCTVYDGLYVALAQTQREEGHSGATVITADERTFLAKLKGTSYEDLAAHVGDIGNFLPIS